MTYTIRPIALCGGPRDLSTYTYRMNVGTGCTTISYVWYIEGSQPKTVIDAGAKAVGGFSDELASLEQGFAKMGLTPEEIEIVVFTHLHNDHIALGSRYKRARFIVQERELDYARNPHPIDAHLYEAGLFEDLDLMVIEGEKEIIPGLTVFPTPGHSPGGQSVEIATAAGKAIVTGFCCHLATFNRTAAMEKRGWEVSAPLIHHDVREVYDSDSVLKVKSRADIILATHDPVFVGKDTIP